MESRRENLESKTEEQAANPLSPSLVTPSLRHPVILDPRSSILDPRSSSPSSWRAWCSLVLLCWQRQARARQMVWIALALLGFSAVLVALTTARGRWGMHHWRWRVPNRPAVAAEKASAANKGEVRSDPGPGFMYGQVLEGLEQLAYANPWPSPAQGLQTGLVNAWRVTLDRSGFYRFSVVVVFGIFLSFLLPIWSLSFATEALGGEREARSLLWLLTRPLPRPAIYLAKFVALLPWSLGLNLGGFGLLCLLAGWPGYQAFSLFWPAVLWASLAFVALFHLMGACFRRAAVVGLVYAFFLETLLGNMPGLMKRISISFYARCMMFDVAGQYGVQAEKPSIYLPVSGWTAWCVLMGLTGIFLLLGMVVFARSEYQDLN